MEEIELKKEKNNKFGEKERLISISDIIEYILRKWLVVVVFLIIGLIGVCGYKYMSDKKAYVSSSDDVKKVDYEETLTEDEISQVDNSYALYQQLKQQQEYINTSILMQVDSFNENRGFLQYKIDANSDIVDAVNDAVTNYVQEGGISEQLKNQGEDEPDKLLELISVVGVSDDGNQANVDNSDYVLSVRVIQKNEQKCQKLANEVTNAIMAYSDQLKEDFGDVNIILFNCSYQTVIDSSLQDYQYENLKKVTSIQEYMDNQNAKLNDNQKAFLNEKITEEDSKDYAGDTEILAAPQFSKKYAVLGAVIGFVCAVIILILRYLSKRTLNIAVELKEILQVSVLGQINEQEKNNILVNIWRKIVNHKKTLSVDQEKQIALKNVTSYCEKMNLSNILIAGCLTDLEKNEWVAELERVLEEQNIKTEIAGNILENPKALDKLSAYSNVVFVEKLHVSKYEDVVCEIEKCTELNVSVIGAIVLN